MSAGISAGPTETAARGAGSITRSQTGSGPPESRELLMQAPMRFMTRKKPVRVGLAPTAGSRRRLPGTKVAAAIQKAAEETSPGTVQRAERK